MHRIFGGLVCLWCGVSGGLLRADEAARIFERRILPIFQAPQPSSCTECHLSGVDLKDYLQADQAATFSALLKAGLIDLKQPDDSKILNFINRTPERKSLVMEKVRQEELAAFREWIRAAVKDPELLTVKPADTPAGPELPVEIIRHARRDRVLASFVDNVWSEVGRCAACHSPDRNAQQVKKFGAQVSWIKPRDPQATLDDLLETELIDTRKPELSLLLRKPLLEVEHGGGQKMLKGDRTYQQFRRFLDDLAAVQAGRYARAEDLPRPSSEVSQASEIWLKVTGVPAEYDKLLMQVDLYHWIGSGWTPHRVATSDRAVFGGGRLWQHSLSLTAPRNSPQAGAVTSGRLPGGRYLAKIYLDRTGRLRREPASSLGPADLAGQVELQSQWPEGYGKMTVIAFPESSQAAR